MLFTLASAKLALNLLPRNFNMTPEKIAVVTDSGASVRPEYPAAQELGITVVPLDIIFDEGGQLVSYPDLDFTPAEFYRRMRESEKPPKTSGAITGRIAAVYQRLSEKTDSVISIHITAKHSVAWQSAVAGAKIAKETRGALSIAVIDSRQLSLGTWFLAELAAQLSQKGAGLEQIKEEVLETIPKVELRVVLESLDNLKAGGRAPEVVQAYFMSLIRVSPVLGLVKGKLGGIRMERTPERARERMVEMVGDSGQPVKMAVLHTNAIGLAGEVRERLARIYQGEIRIFDAGPVLGVHAGPGAVGVVFQIA